MVIPPPAQQAKEGGPCWNRAQLSLPRHMGTAVRTSPRAAVLGGSMDLLTWPRLAAQQSFNVSWMFCWAAGSLPLLGGEKTKILAAVQGSSFLSGAQAKNGPGGLHKHCVRAHPGPDCTEGLGCYHLLRGQKRKRTFPAFAHFKMWISQRHVHLSQWFNQLSVLKTNHWLVFVRHRGSLAVLLRKKLLP